MEDALVWMKGSMCGAAVDIGINSYTRLPLCTLLSKHNASRFHASRTRSGVSGYHSAPFVTVITQNS